MSLNGDGRTIHCDGADALGNACNATMQAPVALRPHLSRLVGRASLAAPDSVHRAGGWLSMSGRENGRHYCPKCAQAFVHALLHGDEPQSREELPTAEESPDASTRHDVNKPIAPEKKICDKPVAVSPPLIVPL